MRERERERERELLKFVCLQVCVCVCVCVEGGSEGRREEGEREQNLHTFTLIDMKIIIRHMVQC